MFLSHSTLDSGHFICHAISVPARRLLGVGLALRKRIVIPLFESLHQAFVLNPLRGLLRLVNSQGLAALIVAQTPQGEEVESAIEVNQRVLLFAIYGLLKDPVVLQAEAQLQPGPQVFFRAPCLIRLRVDINQEQVNDASLHTRRYSFQDRVRGEPTRAASTK